MSNTMTKRERQRKGAGKPAAVLAKIARVDAMMGALDAAKTPPAGVLAL